MPIPQTNKITCLNDWRPVALTPIFSKCFEKLVREHICSVLPASLDPIQFAYRSNRSTDNAIAFTLHTALSHLENKYTYVRMLFVDYSSAFNTIVPATLVAKLQTLGLNRSLCSWILDFLTGRCQMVRMGNNTSSPLTLNTGLETARLATAKLCKGSCELPATLLEVSFPPSRTSTPGGVQAKPGGLSKTPANCPTVCSLCYPQGDVSAASDPALAD